MKQRVALAIAVAGLVLTVHWATAAGAGEPSRSVARPTDLDMTIGEGHQDARLVCLEMAADINDNWNQGQEIQCLPGPLGDPDDPLVIDMRPVHLETTEG